MTRKEFKNLPAGAEFKYQGKTYKVVECDGHNSCINCAFIGDYLFNYCLDMFDDIPNCFALEREDEKDVIFVEVKEE